MVSTTNAAEVHLCEQPPGLVRGDELMVHMLRHRSSCALLAFAMFAIGPALPTCSNEFWRAGLRCSEALDLYPKDIDASHFRLVRRG